MRLLAAKPPSRGPQGWPGAASSVWFSPSCPGTSDARLAMEAPVSWERHKAPTVGLGRAARGGPCARCTPGPHSTCGRCCVFPPEHGSRLPLVPALFALPPDPPHWVGLGQRAEPRTGGRVPRAVRDLLACLPPAVSPQQPPGSPADQPGRPPRCHRAVLLSINQPRVRLQQEWVQRDSLAWEGRSWLGPGRDRGRSDWTR